MASLSLRVWLKCVFSRDGVLCAVMDGLWQMPMWHVGNLDIHQTMVRLLKFSGLDLHAIAQLHNNGTM